jgi:polysaccharide biosynthesis/export protein
MEITVLTEIDKTTHAALTAMVIDNSLQSRFFQTAGRFLQASALGRILATVLVFLSASAILRAQQRPAASAVATEVDRSGGFGSGAAGPVGAGDLVEMSVFDTPELSGKLRVSNRGDVILPLVGSLHVGGLTAGEMENLIRQRLIEGGFMKDPQVTVFIAEYATEGVTVLGEVKNPGVYPALGSHTLVDYISLAGGLTAMAGTNVTVTHCGHPEAPEQVKISSKAPLGSQNNPQILSGDSIFVEKVGLIYVIGDVVRPGGFPMDHDDHLTILQALALAQGTTFSAKKSATVIVRTTAQGRVTIPEDLSKILASKAKDEALQDNDILFIPNSAARTALKNTEAILPVAASATIYRLP